MSSSVEKFQSSRKVSLSKLLLDPNNYRFIDHTKYEPITQSEWAEERIQKRTLQFITGEKNKQIEDLLKSFKANGFLEVDQIQVEEIKDGFYRVLEGNRRVAALKQLQNDHKNSYDIGKLDPAIFSKVPVMVVKQQWAGEHEMIMALKHISGNKAWATLNQAQLLYDLQFKHEWDADQICETLGITRHKLNRDIRTLEIINHYKQSDFGDQFRTEMFAIFRELISSQPVKNWIGWNDQEKKPENTANTERLYAWLSTVEKYKQDEEGKEIAYTEEPIITKSGEVGTLAKFIDDEEAIEQMERTRSITEAYGISKYVGVDKYTNAIQNIESQLTEAQTFSDYAPVDSHSTLLKIRNRIDGLLVSQGGNKILVGETTRTAKPICDFTSNQFSSLTFEDFKGFPIGMKVEGFNRINLIAGDNNAGKTSFLEAVYLLANLNDFNGILNAYRQRGKFASGVPSSWLAETIQRPFAFSGNFDGKPVSLHIERRNEESTEINRTDYLFSLFHQANFNGESFETKSRLFREKSPEIFFEKNRHICRSAFSSPFYLTDRKKVAEYHEIAVEKGVLKKVVEFIQQEIDPNILSIESTGEADDFRFWVTHLHFDKPIDITEFGEGLQRIFFIGLQIASAEKGILCIDEAENAIHYSLLINFTKFLQILADRFNVQLFISTHSNECIKAFFANEYENDAITGYRLRKGADGVNVQKASGEQLRIQIENFQLDLRSK